MTTLEYLIQFADSHYLYKYTISLPEKQKNLKTINKKGRNSPDNAS